MWFDQLAKQTHRCAFLAALAAFAALALVMASPASGIGAVDPKGVL